MYKHYPLKNCQTLTSSQGDFHARILAFQEIERAWKASEAVYFSNSYESVAQLSQDSSFWKMSLPLFPWEEQRWCENLPRWGMIVDGVLYPLLESGLYTDVIDGSFWPTLLANDANRLKPFPSDYQRANKSLPVIVNLITFGKNLNPKDGKKMSVEWLELLMGYPMKYTELKLSEMESFRNKSNKHGTY